MNELDDQGDIPLDLALSTRQESIAKTLINHKANVNQTDNRGWALIHKAINRGIIVSFKNKVLLNFLNFFKKFINCLAFNFISYRQEIFVLKSSIQ